jgi:hypothetical protein
MADSNARVYGWSGRANSSPVGASSTMVPRYMTATRRARYFTLARSCEMKRYVIPSLSLSLSSSRMTRARSETSRAEVGSSSTTNRGWVAMARAMLTRWR